MQNGPDERSIPGNTIAVQADMPFSGLTSFGTAFLSKFECSQMPHPLLENITLVDTPGVLSGEKQRTQRSYEFTGVTSWFAAKSDLILLLFDPHKLDISDEFKRVIASLQGHDDKIRVVLNKADQVDTQQLMRVYGALMWSLGKVQNTPEVSRVYIGSFNDKPIDEDLTGPLGKELFEKEQDDLLTDLKNIPKKACDRCINEFVKRARAAKIHAYIISHLKKEMPAMMGKAKTQKKLIDNLEDVFVKRKVNQKIKAIEQSTYHPSDGAHIGPEPTTDRFVVVMNGPDERSISGNTIAVHVDMPFSGLTSFGTAFLSKFECSQMPNPLLENITLVDTPGVLSGEKQRTQRSYEFTGVTSWFAAKSDLILLLFDPHKLDISDEFKRVIASLQGHDDKIRVVLNKADQVDTQQLMRVYGALMWSLGKVQNTPEVSRGLGKDRSFNDKPIDEDLTGPLGKELFKKEQDDLLTDLKNIPKKACDRRINEFVKRARAVKIHAYIISHLKKEMPAMMGKAKTQKKLIDNLEDVFVKIQKEHHLPAGDFPNVEKFKEVLSGYNFDKFEKLKPKLIQGVDDMLGYDIPELLKNFKNPYD
ncbi:hypothetical protein P3S67_020390 [Capsicum chacoense]